MKRFIAAIATLTMLFTSAAFAGKTVFSNGDPSHGIKGTVVTAQFLNAIQNHRHDGLNQDGSEPINYGADTGTANAYIISLTPALTVNITGMPISFKALNTNTGASTLKIDALTAIAIKRPDGSALLAGDIVAGQVATVQFDGTNYQLLNPVLAANAVNATTATNANNLLADGVYRTASATPGPNVIPVGDSTGRIVFAAKPKIRATYIQITSTAIPTGANTVCNITYYSGELVTVSGNAITIPTGISKIRIGGCVAWNNNTTGTRTLGLYNNGTNHIYYVETSFVPYMTTLGSGQCFTYRPFIDVAAGTLQVFVYQASGGSITIGGTVSEIVSIEWLE